MLNRLQVNKLIHSFSLPALFYSLIIGLWYTPSFNTVLTFFDGNQIGEATLSALDIKSRVRSIYVFMFAIIISYLIFERIFNNWNIKLRHKIQKLETSIIGIGCIQAVLCFVNPAITGLLIIPIALHVALYIAIIHRKCSDEEALLSYFALALILWQLIIWFIPFNLMPIAHLAIILGNFAILEIILRLSKIENLSKIANAAAIISLLPLLTIESNYFFREQLSIPISGIFSSLFILSILLIFTFIYVRKFGINALQTTPITWLLIACGLGIQTFYNPYGIASTELFELANRATPLMEYHFFQNIPLLEKASSHLVSDYGSGLVYQLIYGYHGLDFMIFDLIDSLGWIILSFLLIYQITNNKLISFYAVALFPFFDSTLNPYYSWAFLPLILLIQAFNNPTTKLAWLFGISVTLLLPWRADLSFGILLSLIGIIFVGLYYRRIKFKFLLPSIICLAILAITLLSISISKQIDWISSLKSTIDYLLSSQSYGLTNLGDQNSNQFTLHHLILPIAITFVGYFSMINIKTISKSENSSAFIAISYLSIFYVVNLPRGVVRHGFAEGFDNFLDSYAPFIIILWCSITFVNNRKNQFWIALLSITVFQLYLRFPNRIPENTLVHASIFKPININSIPFKHQSQRLKTDSISLQHKIFPLVNFLRQNLKEEETFIDFGNTPMLYFYAEKQVPAFFYQSPQNVHSISLQKDWIKRLENFNVPLFLFRHHPSEWWDATDGVPNELRHYLIAEYAYKNYFPWKQVSGYEIWKSKSPSDTLLPEFMGPRLYEYYNLQKLPAIWKPLTSQTIQGKSISKSIKSIEHSHNIEHKYQLPANKPIWLELKIRNYSANELSVRISLMQANDPFGGYDFTTNANSVGTYKIRMSILASWWLVNIDQIRISIPKGVLLEDVTFASESN
jgi:hypothetical protein